MHDNFERTKGVIFLMGIKQLSNFAGNKNIFNFFL